MNHLYKVPCSRSADISIAVLRRDCLAEPFNFRENVPVAANCQAGAMSCAFQPAACADVNKMYFFVFEEFVSSDRIIVERIASVNYYVVFFQIRQQFLDHCINWMT